jgi:hypothetical protein
MNCVCVVTQIAWMNAIMYSPRQINPASKHCLLPRRSYTVGPNAGPTLGHKQGFAVKMLGQFATFGPIL